MPQPWLSELDKIWAFAVDDEPASATKLAWLEARKMAVRAP